MVNETRINLKHLLEDIRDSYTFPIEEVIITELTANALDSSASKIEFLVDPEMGTLACRDNGTGMRRKELKEYHNIAMTTKTRGTGIGFAGVGAKLALLIAEMVITETRGPHHSHTATEWSLTSLMRAPWKFIVPPGSVLNNKGTAVTIKPRHSTSLLLTPLFVEKTLTKHFYPLLHPVLREHLFRFVYKRAVEFLVNGSPVILPEIGAGEHLLQVYLGKQKHPIGIGFLVKNTSNVAKSTGLAISTYGKIIKAGWEWIGITPRSPWALWGIVEIPLLAELLTTNKNDFLSNAGSLKKYYRYRKAIQESLIPLLAELEESPERSEEKIQEKLKPLTRDIERALGFIAPQFPELTSLVGIRRRFAEKTVEAEKEHGRAVGIQEVEAEEMTTSTDKKELSMREKETDGENITSLQIPDDHGLKRRKMPGLKIAFEEYSDQNLLGRIAGETVWINKHHPAWERSQKTSMEDYHVVMTVAMVLSEFLEEHHAPQEFIAKFLAFWATKESPNAQKLFET